MHCIFSALVMSILKLGFGKKWMDNEQVEWIGVKKLLELCYDVIRVIIAIADKEHNCHRSLDVITNTKTLCSTKIPTAHAIPNSAQAV